VESLVDAVCIAEVGMVIVVALATVDTQDFVVVAVVVETTYSLPIK
jgi:hypothetical protein